MYGEIENKNDNKCLCFLHNHKLLFKKLDVILHIQDFFDYRNNNIVLLSNYKTKNKIFPYVLRNKTTGHNLCFVYDKQCQYYCPASSRKEMDKELRPFAKEYAVNEHVLKKVETTPENARAPPVVSFYINFFLVCCMLESKIDYYLTYYKKEMKSLYGKIQILL